MLSVLDGFVLTTPESVSRIIADDFKRRRIEKNMTRRDVAMESKVPLATITRFEQQGLISLTSLIRLAMAMGYVAELKTIFAKPKYSTMDELLQVNRNQGKKRAYSKHSKRAKKDKQS